MPKNNNDEKSWRGRMWYVVKIRKRKGLLFKLNDCFNFYLNIYIIIDNNETLKTCVKCIEVIF